MAESKSAVIEVSLDKDPNARVKKGLIKRLSKESKTKTATELATKHNDAALRRKAENEIKAEKAAAETKKGEHIQSNIQHFYSTPDEAKAELETAYTEAQQRQNALKEKAQQKKLLAQAKREAAKMNALRDRALQDKALAEQEALEMDTTEIPRHQEYKFTVPANSPFWRVACGANIRIRSEPKLSDVEILGTLKVGQIFAGKRDGDWIQHAQGWSMMSADGVILIESNPSSVALEVSLPKNNNAKAKKGLIQRLSKKKSARVAAGPLKRFEVRSAAADMRRKRSIQDKVNKAHSEIEKVEQGTGGPLWNLSANVAGFNPTKEVSRFNEYSFVIPRNAPLWRVVINGNVRVRSQPTTDGMEEILGILKEYDIVRGYQVGDWLHHEMGWSMLTIDSLVLLRRNDSLPKWRVGPDADVRIRSQPTTESKNNVTGVLTEGDVISGYRVDDWIRHERGWSMVAVENLTLIQPDEELFKWRVACRAFVRIRSQPTLDAGEVLGLLEEKEVVSGTKEGEWLHHEKGWSMITFDGLTLLRPAAMEIKINKNPNAKPKKGLKKRLSQERKINISSLADATARREAIQAEKAGKTTQKISAAQRKAKSFRAKRDRRKADKEAAEMKSNEIPRDIIDENASNETASYETSSVAEASTETTTKRHWGLGNMVSKIKPSPRPR